MPLTTPSETDLTIQRVDSLLKGLPRLLERNQSLAAFCQFYWLMHCAERDFLETPIVEKIIQARELILSLCSLPDKIHLCERLEKLGGRFHLDAEQVKLDHQLSQLKRIKKPGRSQIEFCMPEPKDEQLHLASLSHLTSARHKLCRLPDEERTALTLTNTEQLNTVEMQYFYDLVASFYLEQLREMSRTEPDKIMRVLHTIALFTKRLQAICFYPQIYTLYYQIFKTLSIQQPFYETTCLSRIDERFLLENLCEFQESILADLPPKVTLTPDWSHNLSALQHLRTEKKSSVAKLMPCIDVLRYSPDLTSTVETLQANITASMKNFFTRLFKQTESLLGQPPMDYCLIALGSFVRGDMTPFSDLESVLLVEQPCPSGSLDAMYFERLWNLVAFQVNALGESYDEYPGLHIDGECHPLLPGMTTTPEILVKTYGLNAVTTDEHTEGTLALTLLNSTTVYSHEDTRKPEKLWDRYHRLLNETLKTAIVSDESTTSSSPASASSATSATILLRHQKAQAQLLTTVERFNAKKLPNFLLGCSIKEAFLNPIAHLLANLSFYHHMDRTRHSDILQYLIEKNFLHPMFAKHFRAAIAELNLLRLHHHLENNASQDNLSAKLPEPQQKRLEQIWQGLICPLFHTTHQLTHVQQAYHPTLDKITAFNDEITRDISEETKEISIVQLIQYLLYIQSPKKPFKHFITAYQRLPVSWRPILLTHLQQITLWPIDHELQTKTLTALEAQANPDGWQPRMVKETQCWQQTILTLFGAPLSSEELARTIENEEIIAYMPSSDESEKRLLAFQFKEPVLSQLFDKHGNPITGPEMQPGRHLVQKVTHEGQIFWFKFMPEQPGTEFAISRLARYLGAQNTPMTQIIKITRNQQEHAIAIQISSNAPGVTLESCIESHPNYLMNISKASFTQTLFRVLLTNPEDDKGDDYFLVSSEGGTQYDLMRIDNERAYYQPDTTEGRLIKTKVLQVKSALYCLHQMQEPLDHLVLEAFSRLDTFLMLDHWLKELAEEHDNYILIFQEEDVRNHFNNTFPGPSILALPMAEGLMKELLTRLDSMQQVIHLKMKAHKLVTGMGLLEVVQPKLAEYYQAAFKKIPTPETANDPEEIRVSFKRRLDTINKLYQVTPQGYKQSSYSNVKAMTQSLRLKQDLTEEDVVYIAHSQIMNPMQALIELKHLQAMKSEHIERALLAGSKESISAFQQLPIRHRLLIIKHITELVTTGELILTKAQQMHCLKAMAKTPFHELSLFYFQLGVIDSLLTNILRGAHKHLITLDLTYCKQVTGKLVITLAENCPHLEVLILKDINNTDKYLFEKRNKLIVIENLFFPCLKQLDLSACQQLIRIQVQAPMLETLSARNCSQLHYIETGSSKLTNVDLQDNPMLIESGVEHLTLLPEQLKILTLVGCNRLVYATFRERYPELGTASLSELSLLEIEKITEKIAAALKTLDKTWQALPQTIISEFANSMRSFCISRRQFLRRVTQDFEKTLKKWDTATAAASALAQLTQASSHVINMLMNALRDKESHVRVTVASALASITLITPSVNDVLVKALADEDSNMRVGSALALGQSGQNIPSVIDILIDVLESEQEAAAITALGKLKLVTPRIIDAIAKQLTHWSKGMEEAAAAALAELCQISPQIIDIFLKALERNNSTVMSVFLSGSRRNATKAPREDLSMPSVIRALVTALKNNDPDIKIAAASVIKKLGKAAPQIIDLFVKFLEDTDEQIKKNTDSSLGELSIIDNFVIGSVLERLGNTNWQDKRTAVLALGYCDVTTPSIINALLKTLEDTHSKVRKATASALGQLSKTSPWIIEALIKLLVDPSLGKDINKVSVISALGQCGLASPQVSDALNKALVDEDKYVKVEAISVLGQLGLFSSKVIDNLIKALEDEEHNVKVAAIRTLEKSGIRTSRVIKALGNLVEDENQDVRIAAAFALGRLDKISSLVIDILVKGVENRESEAAKALEKLGISSPQVINALLNMLSKAADYGWNKRTRIFAVTTLGRLLNCNSLIMFFERLLTHASPESILDKSIKPTALTLPHETVGSTSLQRSDSLFIAPTNFKKRVALFDEEEMSATMQDNLRQLVVKAFPATDYTVGKTFSDGDCFFDAVAQALIEAQGLRTISIESLRHICAEYAKKLERKHSVTTMEHEENAEDINWIFKALRQRHDLYQKYLLQVASTAEEANALEADYKIGDGLAVWGEQAIDAVILCKHFGIQIHVIELHDEVLENPELPPILHQLIDSDGVHPLEHPDNDIYLSVKTIHLIVARNHFCPILKATTLTESYEHHGFLRPPLTTSNSSSSAPANISPRLNEQGVLICHSQHHLKPI